MDARTRASDPPRGRPPRALPVFLLAAALAWPPSPARPADPVREDVRPPFGLQWRETPDQIMGKLDAAKASVMERKMVGPRLSWTVEGILHAGLRRSVFYFQDDGLVEVELQYQGSDWDTRKYEAFMADIRGKIEARFGPGQLIAKSKKTEGEIIQTLVGYKWTQPSTAIKLVYFSAENADQIYRTISVHYMLQ